MKRGPTKRATMNEFVNVPSRDLGEGLRGTRSPGRNCAQHLGRATWDDDSYQARPG